MESQPLMLQPSLTLLVVSSLLIFCKQIGLALRRITWGSHLCTNIFPSAPTSAPADAAS